MSSHPTTQRVHIEFQRVQTWLFAVPRLRAMVGANALLGETLRVALPKLARDIGRGWVLAPCSDAYPGADHNDPLNNHDDPDDPAADAKDGILARDGGHFEAQFKSGAKHFADAAGQLLRTSVPGLRFRVSVDGEQRIKSQVHLSTELPVLAPCEWTGRGLASAIVTRGNPKDQDYEQRAVSLDALARETVGERAAEDNACDLASLLSGRTKLRKLKRAQELKQLVGNGYLALIHADGNGVGSGAGKAESERAAFFHRNRVLLRRALKKALDDSCDRDEKRRDDEKTRAEKAGQKPEIYAPVVPLMLGGDDLLLLARAETAVAFVVTLCEELDALQQDSTGFKLTLGVGIVFAKHTIPIYRLHEVAEQLAGSAKRRFRGMKDGETKRSVVDWAVYNATWVDDPEVVRRRDWLRGSGSDLRVLSQRPIDVLGQGLDSLQGLVRGAGSLAQAPRSQLRYLVEQLPRGRALSELAFAELSKEAKRPFAEVGVQDPWRRAANNGPWTTALLDLVEIAEIARLGRGEHSRTDREAAHV